MDDLFGLLQKEKQDHTSEYNKYINSPTWKRIRDAKIDEVGGVCERCGISKWSTTLEVHHLTYDRFKHERISDLQVLCHECHEIADQERKQIAEHKKEKKRHTSPLKRGFEEWMDKGKQKNWRMMCDDYLCNEWNKYLQSVFGNNPKYRNTKYRRDIDWR